MARRFASTDGLNLCRAYSAAGVDSDAIPLEKAFGVQLVNYDCLGNTVMGRIGENTRQYTQGLVILNGAPPRSLP